MTMTVVLVAWCLIDVRNRAAIDPANPTLHMTDLTVYTEAGAAMFDGRDPYAVSNLRNWHYIYPPLTAMLLAPLAALDTQWQAIIWFAISLALLLGCFAESRRIWRWVFTEGRRTVEFRRIFNVPWIVWIIGGAVVIPALNCLQRGQVDVFFVYFMLLGTRLVFTGRTFTLRFAGGAALALSVAIKVIPALPVLFLCLLLTIATFRVRGRSDLTSRAAATCLGVTVGLGLFLIIIPCLVVGPSTNFRYLRTFTTQVLLNEGGASDGDIALHALRNQSLDNAVYRLGNFVAYVAGAGPDDSAMDRGGSVAGGLPMDAPWVYRALLGTKLVLLSLLIGAGVTAARRNDSVSLITAFSLSWLMMVVVSPVFRGHYYVLWWLPVWFVPLYLYLSGQARLAYALGISALALTWGHYLFLEIAGRVGLLGIGTTVWYLIAALSFIMSRSRDVQADRLEETT